MKDTAKQSKPTSDGKKKDKPSKKKTATGEPVDPPIIPPVKPPNG